MEKIVKGVGVNLDNPALRTSTSVEDINKTNIFEHLHGEEREEAEDELWEHVQEYNDSLDSDEKPEDEYEDEGEEE